MSKLKFVNLHNHTTSGSVFDAIGYPKDYIDYVHETGGSAMAFTEHGNCNSYPHYYFYTEKLKQDGINFKSIPGVEAYFIDSLTNWRIIKEKQDIERKAKKNFKEVPIADTLTYELEDESKKIMNDPIKHRNHLVLLAKNSIGLESLFTLVSRSFKEGFYNYPRMDFDSLKEHSEGLVCLSGCLAGPFASRILKMKYDGISETEIQKELLNLTDKFVNHFGEENFFFEIQFNALEQQHVVNEYLIKLAKATSIKLVATNDAHYPRPEQWQQRALYRKLSPKFASFAKSDECHLMLPQSIDELGHELYPKDGDATFAAYKKYCVNYDFYEDDKVREAIENSWHIAHDIIDKEISFDKSVKSVAHGKNEFNQLVRLAIQGLKNLNLDTKSEYVERLKYELEIIKEKKFERYFLTLYKGVNEISKHMLIGPARGSGGGSLLNYVLGITQMDPIKYNLIFERFINPARDSYPDVDLDFEDKPKATKLLRKIYGDDKVISISNYNTLQLKSLIKDVAKFNNIPFQEVNQVTKVMEKEVRAKVLKKGDDKNLFKLTLNDTKEHSSSFKALVKKYPELGKHIDVLFEQVKSVSRHAGGVLIADNIDKKMPVIISKGERQSPWTEGVAFKHLEEMGFLKFDCLALLTLRIIRTTIEKLLVARGEDPCFENVKAFYNQHLHPDIADLNDQSVFKNVWHNGRYPEIFQFSEKGAQGFGTKLKPTSVEDISSATSIFRPGPLAANVDKKFIKDKENPKAVIYEHPALKEVFETTYGHIVYQEQVMAIANRLAGFSMPECDKLRKIIMKRTFENQEESLRIANEWGEKFADGCEKNNYPREKALELWDRIKFCAGYLFNRCLDENTEVETQDGKKKIKNVVVGDRVLSKNGFVNVTKIFDQGKQQCYKIKTKSGKVLVCTMDHKLETSEGTKTLREIIEKGLKIIVKEDDQEG